VVHRADLQNILISSLASLSVPVQIHLGSKVISLDPGFAAKVQLQSGEWIEGDVVICADGIKSSFRSQFLSSCWFKGEVKPTGDAAYRVLIPKEKLKGDLGALELLNRNVGTRWMGPGGHIMGYPIRNNTVYNMVLLHPLLSQDTKHTLNEEEIWTRKGSKAEMHSFYASWNSTVRNMLDYVEDGEVVEWVLNTHPPLPTWVKGRCILVGDASHPMLPYVAQGAAQGIEDAAVLACVLAMITSASEVEKALKVFQVLRKERAERIQASAAETRRALHLPDGEEQRKRDQRMRAAGKGTREQDGKKCGEVNVVVREVGQERNPDLWADEQWQEYMWGVDVMSEVFQRWGTLIQEV
jgi:2-polyprenyl-6-methoxyphenol hydroxylase-like FAD-dependent oxidoreductase